MVSQTNSVNRTAADEMPLRSVARTTTEFADDFITLAELQTKLAILECREGAGQLIWPGLCAATGILVAAGLVPIALLTFGAMLIEFASLSPVQALGISLALGLAISGGLLLGAYAMVRANPKPFARTTREWDANSRWLRNMVRRQSRRWS